MDMPATKTCKGRPREFCVEQALAAALGVFWTKGYEGTSLSDLTEAMGITRPSLYAAFGNKEELFRKALDLYEREKLAYVQEALAAPTSRGVAERLLKGALETLTGECVPRGCLRIIGSMTCGSEAGSVRDDLHSRRASSQAAVVARMEQAKADGDLPEHTDVEGISNYLLAIIQGLSVQANSGATKEQLEEVVRTSLAIWPGR
jgi:AcrR family transcriptional regulator